MKESHPPNPKVLVIATNFTDEDLADRVQQGLYQRVDYMDLAKQTGGEYVDYGAVPDNLIFRKIEALSRLDFRLAFKVARLVKEQGYTTVVSFSERVGIPLAPLLPQEVKHIVIQHHPLSRRRLLLEKVSRVHRRWNRLVTISAAEKEALPAVLDIQPERITTLHCPVDTAFFTPRSNNGSSGSQDHIESLGLSHRDYPTLIQAMRLLPQVPCYIRYGSIWSHGEPDFDTHHLPANITLQPFVAPDLLREKIAESCFIVVPVKNVTQWSTGSTTVQIAQAMGKAVIATALPGLREYIKDGETGILVAPEDPQAMAEAIQTLWAHPEQAKEMGQRGSALMKAKFSMDAWLEKMQGLI